MFSQWMSRMTSCEWHKDCQARDALADAAAIRVVAVWPAVGRMRQTEHARIVFSAEFEAPFLLFVFCFTGTLLFT